MPSYRSYTSAHGSSGTSLTTAKPTGLANGDFVIVRVATTLVADAQTWTGPTGFTPIQLGTGIQAMWGKRITDAAGEPADYTATWTVSGRCRLIAVAIQPGAGEFLGVLDSELNPSGTTQLDTSLSFPFVSMADTGLRVTICTRHTSSIEGFTMSSGWTVRASVLGQSPSFHIADILNTSGAGAHTSESATPQLNQISQVLIGHVGSAFAGWGIPIGIP